MRQRIMRFLGFSSAHGGNRDYWMSQTLVIPRRNFVAGWLARFAAGKPADDGQHGGPARLAPVPHRRLRCVLGTLFNDPFWHVIGSCVWMLLKSQAEAGWSGHVTFNKSFAYSRAEYTHVVCAVNASSRHVDVSNTPAELIYEQSVWLRSSGGRKTANRCGLVSVSSTRI